MAYAETTTVPVERSIAEIVTLVKKAGAQRIMQFEEPARFVVQFELGGRLIRFSVPFPQLAEMPTHDGRQRALTALQRESFRIQRSMQRARALLLVIKAKLESVASKVETFEEAFLPNVVMSDGRTVYERIAEPIQLEYESGKPSMLMLEGPRK